MRARATGYVADALILLLASSYLVLLRNEALLDLSIYAEETQHHPLEEVSKSRRRLG